MTDDFELDCTLSRRIAGKTEEARKYSSLSVITLLIGICWALAISGHIPSAHLPQTDGFSIPLQEVGAFDIQQRPNVLSELEITIMGRFNGE